MDATNYDGLRNLDPMKQPWWRRRIAMVKASVMLGLIAVVTFAAILVADANGLLGRMLPVALQAEQAP